MAESIDRTEEQLDLWRSGSGIEFADTEAGTAYRARAGRIADAIQLKKPDRVPFVPMWEYFYARYAGVTCHDVIYDPDIARRATVKTVTELSPDAFEGPTFYNTGAILDALDITQLKWPGHGLPADFAHQFIEAEYMKADEYPALLSDPSDFMLRKYLPHICGSLKAFEALRPLRYMFGYFTIYPNLTGFGTPEGLDALRKLGEAAQASVRYIEFLESVNAEIKALGFPMWSGALAGAPFDAISDTLRGTNGSAMDLYRQPQLVKEACEFFTQMFLETAIATTRANGVPIVFIPLHKGTAPTRDGKGALMSIRQFEEFYWPSLKKVMLGLIDHGLVPNLFIEGDYTSRLDIIKDVPPGKCIYHFENIDLEKAKKALGDRVCMRGAVPISTLVTGTPDEVKAKCRRVIDILGEGGGYLMDAAVASEDIRPENMRAMIESCREYGTYR